MEDPHNLGTEFTCRFTPEGDGYVFRARPWAAGYAFTSDEFDRLAGDYIRRSGLLVAIAQVWFMVGAMFGVLVATTMSHSVYVLSVLTLVVCLPIGVTHFRLLDRPVRELRGRAIATPALPWSEAWRLRWAQVRPDRASIVLFWLPLAVFAAISYVERSFALALVLFVAWRYLVSVVTALWRLVRRRWFAGQPRSAPTS